MTLRIAGLFPLNSSVKECARNQMPILERDDDLKNKPIYNRCIQVKTASVSQLASRHH
jgi:hypothetical protein